MLDISSPYIWGENFNVQSVFIRQLGKLTLLLIGNLYTWVKNYDVQCAIFRQLGMVTWKDIRKLYINSLVVINLLNGISNSYIFNI